MDPLDIIGSWIRFFLFLSKIHPQSIVFSSYILTGYHVFIVFIIWNLYIKKLIPSSSLYHIIYTVLRTNILCWTIKFFFLNGKPHSNVIILNIYFFITHEVIRYNKCDTVYYNSFNGARHLYYNNIFTIVNGRVRVLAILYFMLETKIAFSLCLYTYLVILTFIVYCTQYIIIPWHGNWKNILMFP